jgi:hypothetical protein
MSPRHTSSLLTVNVMIRGHLVTALIESGCTVERVFSVYCTEKLVLVLITSFFKAERWDGSISPLEVVTQPLILNLSGQLDGKGVKPYIAEYPPFDLIIGIDWLRKYNPGIKWKSDTLPIFDGSRRRSVRFFAQSSSTISPNYVILPKQLKISAQKGATVFLAQLHLVGMGDSARLTVSVGKATSRNVGGTHSEGPANKGNLRP